MFLPLNETLHGVGVLFLYDLLIIGIDQSPPRGGGGGGGGKPFSGGSCPPPPPPPPKNPAIPRNSLISMRSCPSILMLVFPARIAARLPPLQSELIAAAGLFALKRREMKASWQGICQSMYNMLK